MGGHEADAGNFDRPIRVDAANDMAELCDRIRDSLQSNHVHCPEADRTGLSERLLQHDAQLWRILGKGFDHIVVFDVNKGVTKEGGFDLRTFLLYIKSLMADVYGLEADDEEFHPEEISQILKDVVQSTTLFCFVGIQHIPYEDLQRLRGFTQEGHRCLFCGHHEFDPGEARPSLAIEDYSRADLLISLAGDDSDIAHAVDSVAMPLQSDSGVSLTMDTINVAVNLPSAGFLDSLLFQDHSRKQDTMLHHASLLLARGQIDQAMVWLEATESECVEGDETWIACLGHQAKVEIARGDTQAAMSLLERQQVWLQRAKRIAALAACLGKQATLLRQQRRLSEALALLQQESEIYRETGIAPEFVRSLAGQAQIQTTRADWDGALALLAQQEHVCRLHGFHEQLVKCLGQQAMLLRYTNELELSLAVLREQARVARQINRQDVIAIVKGQQASIHEARGDFALAESLYREGEQLCRQLERHELLARNLINHAFLLAEKLEHPGQALSRAKEAFALATKYGFSSLAAQIEPIYQRIRARVG